MKTMNFERMEQVNGGGFWSSFCVANSIVGLAVAITATAITAGAASFLLAGQATCLLYSATQAIID